jgi:methyl-accepting chemotaxis protein
MPGRSRLSIRTLVGLLISGIGLMLIAQSATLLVVAAPGYLGAQRVAALTVADQAVFQTLYYRRLSDGLMVAALAGDTAVDERDAGTIAENRQRANAAYADAVRLLRELDLPGASAVLETLRTATDAWAEVAPIADSAIRLPRSARDPASVQEQIRRATTSQEATAAANTFIDAAIMPIDPVADRLIQVRRLAWSMRDHMETLMRASSAAAAAAAADGKAPSVDKLNAIVGQRVRVERDWSELTEIANRPDTPQSVVNAIISAGQWYVGAIQVDAHDDLKPVGTVEVIPNRVGPRRQTEVLAALANVASAAVEALRDRASEQTISVTRGLVIDAMSLAIATIVTLAALLVARARVNRPLRAITAAMQRLADGDTEASPEGVGAGAEIDMLANAMLAFRQTMLHATALEAALAGQEAAEAERAAAAEAALADLAQQLAEQLAPVADGLLRLAEGDLTCKLHEHLPPEFDDLRQNFNDALDFLQTSIGQLLGHIAGVNRNAAGLSDTADGLSRRTALHGNTLHQAITALDALAANLDSTRVDSLHAQSTAASIAHQAVSSASLMGEAAEALASLSELPRRVDRIVVQIDEFAFQAHLAAVKAGLAGARLGAEDVTEAAAEIRALAQRAGAAAGEIKLEVYDAHQQVTQSSHKLGESRQVYGRIEAGLGEITDAIDLCATTAQTQSLGLDAFRVLLTQIEQVTEKNATTAQQSIGTARTLADQADAFKAALWRFRLPDAPASDRAA